MTPTDEKSTAFIALELALRASLVRCAHAVLIEHPAAAKAAGEIIALLEAPEDQ